MRFHVSSINEQAIGESRLDELAADWFGRPGRTTDELTFAL
jgi:hypothetical protein